MKKKEKISKKMMKRFISFLSQEQKFNWVSKKDPNRSVFDTLIHVMFNKSKSYTQTATISPPIEMDIEHIATNSTQLKNWEEEIAKWNFQKNGNKMELFPNWLFSIEVGKNIESMISSHLMFS